jgi:hypothetical protein
MANRLKLNQNPTSIPATVSGLRPGDFLLGSVQSRAAARALLANLTAEQAQDDSAAFANLTEYEMAIAEGEDPELVPTLIRLARTVEERAKVFGFSLPTPEQIRRDKAIARIANEITDGQHLQISLADPSEGKRIRDLAEEKLKAEAVGGHKDADDFAPERPLCPARNAIRSKDTGTRLKRPADVI